MPICDVCTSTFPQPDHPDTKYCSRRCGQLARRRRDALAMVGRRFERLTVIEEVAALQTTQHRFFRVRCDCGAERIVTQAHLRSGHTQSCGCLAREQTGERVRTHGHTPRNGWSSEYRIWSGIKQRCRNSKSPAFPRYGGRGIQMCDAWADSFEAFLRDVGRRPHKGLTLDRIDNDGHYQPGNTRWATWREQRLNR